MPISRKLEQVIKLIEEDLTRVRDDFLLTMGNALVDLSIQTIHGGTGSDTGAYMESHSIVQTKGAGRARSSRHKLPAINPAGVAELTRQNLANDVASLPSDVTKVYMNNGSPHAQSVERGDGWGKDGYHIYTRVKREARNYLQEAVMRNKR